MTASPPRSLAVLDTGAGPGPQLDRPLLPSEILFTMGWMASAPHMRDKKERALADGDTTPAETPLQPTKPQYRIKGASRERMLEITKIRQAKIAAGDLSARGGTGRTKFTRAEREEAALAKLMPKALKVLQEQLDDDDPRVRQSAAIKVMEYVKGKPTQTLKQDIDQRVTAIRFETAAFGVGQLPPANILELEEASIIEEDVGNGDGET